MMEQALFRRLLGRQETLSKVFRTQSQENIACDLRLSSISSVHIHMFYIGKVVVSLEYEAYEDMALIEMRSICSKVVTAGTHLFT